MAKHFGVAEDVSYTCETAAHFWLLHVLARWEKFLASVRTKKTPECVKVSSLFCSSLGGRHCPLMLQALNGRCCCVSLRVPCLVALRLSGLYKS